MGNSLSEQLLSIDVDNVFLYVADAVREDSLPQNIRNCGITVSGVASSTHSPSSFATIVSGLHPPTHGVYWFNHTLQEYSLFEVEELNTYYESSMPMASGEDDSFFRIFDLDPEQYHGTVPDFEPPFFAMERGHGGHAPYVDDGSSAPEYFKRNAKNQAGKIREDYKRCVKKDAQHFESRLAALDQRGLLDGTLVIYASDHGELLGEGGMLGHNAPMRPELIRVPSVFIHPELDSKTTVEGVIRHIDFAPTILELLNATPDLRKELPGRSLVTAPPETTGLSFYEREFFSTSLPGLTGQLKYEGAWDAYGGHVFTRSSVLDRGAVFGGKLFKGAKKKFLARNMATSIGSYFRGDHSYGEPQFTQIEARTMLEGAGKSSTDNEIELSQQTKENLHDLGYR